MAMTFITSQGISTPWVSAGSGIDLGDMTANQITSNHQDPSHNKLPNSLALFNAFKHLQLQINNLTGTDDNATIFTDSLVSAPFYSLDQDPDLGWEITGNFIRVANELTITNDPVTGYDELNALSVPIGRYPYPGRYFIHIDIPRVNGIIHLVLNGLIIGSINTPGRHSIGFTIADVNNDRLKLTCVNIPSGGRCEFARCYLVGVQTTLTDYVTYMVENALNDDVNKYVRQSTLDDAISEVTNTLNAHINAADPHSQYLLRSEFQSLDLNDLITAAPSTIPYGNSKHVTPCYIQLNKLMHTSNTTYDSVSGILNSSVDVAIGKVVDLIKPNAYAVFSTNDAIPDITYNYHLPTPLASLKLRGTKLHTVKINSVVVTITLSNGTQQNNTINLSSAWDAASETYEVTHNYTANPSVKSIRLHSFNTTGVGTYALGIDVTHATLNNKPLIVSGVQYQAGGQSYTTGNISLPVEDMVNDHWYAINLIDNTDVVLSPVGPIYNNNNPEASAYPLVSLSSLNPNSTYFGSESWTNDNNPYTLGTLGDKIKYTREFNNAEVINTLRLELDKVYGTSTTVQVALFDEDNNVYTLSNLPAAPNKVVTTVDVLTGRHILSVENIDDVLDNVKRVEVTINSLVVQVKAYKLDLGFTVPVYNANTASWTTGDTRKLMGWIKRSASGIYQVVHSPIMRRYHLPINGYEHLKFFTKYCIPNPFFTTDITVVSNYRLGSLEIYDDSILIVPGVHEVPYELAITKN